MCIISFMALILLNCQQHCTICSLQGIEERLGSGCLLLKAICLNNALETQLRIMFNMNEKLEPLEKADEGFSRTCYFP